MTFKVMTLRINEEKAAELATVARTDEMTVSDAVRDAIAKHIAFRRTDPEFKKRVRELIEEDNKTMRRLAGEEEPQKGK
jgi:hypothetical protein